MKVKNLLIAFCFLIVSIGLSVIILLSSDTFYLETKYYGDTSVEEIDTSKLNRLIATNESFALFVYQPACVNSTNFEIVLTNYQKEKNISIKKITFSNLKGTILEDKIKYYPSFVIFKNGRVVDYLETDKDEDIATFKSVEGFDKWFTKYVKIRKTSNYNNTSVEDEVSTTTEKIVIDLPDIKKEKDKVNIYLFWGDGCPHCEHEQEFFEKIEEEYGHLYNLYKFETWGNSKNANMMKIFGKEMGDSARGVPYTIIGSKSFSGFGTSSEEKFKEAIEEEAKKDFDIYIDVIKDKYKK